jgi:hypothetical protein
VKCTPSEHPDEGYQMPFDGVGFIGNESVRKMDEVIDLLGTPDRWCKGALRSHDGRYCIRGAVRAVDAAETLEPSILEAIGQVAGKRFRRIESFNAPHEELKNSFQRTAGILPGNRGKVGRSWFD